MTYSLTYLLTGVRCRATSVAKNALSCCAVYICKGLSSIVTFYGNFNCILCLFCICLLVCVWHTLVTMNCFTHVVVIWATFLALWPWQEEFRKKSLAGPDVTYHNVKSTCQSYLSKTIRPSKMDVFLWSLLKYISNGHCLLNSDPPPSPKRARWSFFPAAQKWHFSAFYRIRF